MTIRVGVIGAAGRMGQTVCAAISADNNLELVAAVDSAASGSTVEGLTIAKDLRALADAKVEVAVDFTVAAASRISLPWLAMHKVHAVVGTTGFTDADIAEFKKMFTSSNCIVAPNFAIGAVLMMRFAEIAAPFSTRQKSSRFTTTAKQIRRQAQQSQQRIAWLRPAVIGRKTRQHTKRLLVRAEPNLQPSYRFMQFACGA